MFASLVDDFCVHVSCFMTGSACRAAVHGEETGVTGLSQFPSGRRNQIVKIGPWQYLLQQTGEKLRVMAVFLRDNETFMIMCFNALGGMLAFQAV